MRRHRDFSNGRCHPAAHLRSGQYGAPSKIKKTAHTVRPAILSIGIIFFINSWNEYVWPAIMIKSEVNYTLSLALQMFVSSEGGTDVPVAMAVATLTMLLPLGLYAVCQKFIIGTFAQSGIKG